MSFYCFCVKNTTSHDFFTVRVQLLDNTVSEYSLAKTCTGEQCVRKISTEVDLKDIAYFGLKYEDNVGNKKWLSLNKNLLKQITKYGGKIKDDSLLYFKIRFFATQVNCLTEDTTRYFYYLQLRENINEGILSCNEKEALVLASYALQAEYGDYDLNEHIEELIQEYQLLPKNLEKEKSNLQLYSEISGNHQKYMGMSAIDAELAYIKYAQQLECYGHEFYPAKDSEEREVQVGPCARGVFLKYDSDTPIKYFNWPDIVRMTHSKQRFSVETSVLKSVVEMDSPANANYVWQMCVDHHQFHRISDYSKKNSICSVRSSGSQQQLAATKRQSSQMETCNGYPKACDGFINLAFNNSLMEQSSESDESEVPGSKRESRESGIYGSSESKVSPFHKKEFKRELCDGQLTSLPSTSRAVVETESANNDDGIPKELLMSSYKTFGNTMETNHKQLCDTTARRSYPSLSPHSANNDRTSVGRSVSMLVPLPPGESIVDSCSVQTIATSGYSTSTDSGLCNNKTPASPTSPENLLSSGSFVYEDYEVPSIDEQCKKLEAVLSEGRLDVEFARIKLKDKKSSTATGQLPINKANNRYPDILPYEDSRVRLDSYSNVSGNDYINASFIKVIVSQKPYNYIATQAPLETTVTDFWQMIWEQNVKIIVMLYNKKNGHQECYRYWPKHKTDSRQPSRREFGKFEIITQFVNRSPCYTSSGLKLRHKTEHKERTIIHLQFLQWPDNGIPQDPTAFLEFMAEVESIRHNLHQPNSEEETSPVAVHCCAGVGRTGVFILADLMIAQLQNQSRQPFNVSRVLSKLRSQRMLLVRTVDQYRFVYILLIQYLKNSRLI